jgi:SagB-type dehydrogenase family enzyme
LYYLDALDERGLISETIWCADGGPAATLRIVSRFRPPAEEAVALERVQLCRFAFMRRVAMTMILESPRCVSQLVLHDMRMLTAIGRLAQPVSITDAEAIFHFLGPAATVFMQIAIREKFITSESEGDAQPASSGALAGWDFHDLLFHARSRDGRHANRYGASYPGFGRWNPPPVRKELVGCPTIQFPVAKPTKPRTDFDDVLARRRSVRTYAPHALTLTELGVFLNSSARVQVMCGIGDPVSLRPAPSAGARHPLEVYVVANRVMGLESAVYHYDPVDHVLRKIADRNHEMTILLRDAARYADRSPAWEAQAIIVMTARVQRASWKYESVAYANILKDVGALMQTMYLVATSQQLAPCALGGGDSDLFARLCNVNYFEETAVGEFLIGTADLNQ